MRLTDSMLRCLKMLAEHGEARRVYDSKRDGDLSAAWAWRINGIACSGPVERCWNMMLVRIEGDRATLTDKARALLGIKRAA